MTQNLTKFYEEIDFIWDLIDEQFEDVQYLQSKEIEYWKSLEQIQQTLQYKYEVLEHIENGVPKYPPEEITLGPTLIQNLLEDNINILKKTDPMKAKEWEKAYLHDPLKEYEDKGIDLGMKNAKTYQIPPSLLKKMMDEGKARQLKTATIDVVEI